MSNEQPQQTLNDVLIERQGMRLGQMATQIESLAIQVEHLTNILRMNGIDTDGSRLEAETTAILNGEGQEVGVV